MENEKIISVCGLVCSDCDLYKMQFDDEAAENIVGWFKGEGWIKPEEGKKEILERKMYCVGCQSDRSGPHWSSDCYLLICATEDHKVENCSLCSKFVCKKLEDWEVHADWTTKYKAGVDRLRKMKADREGKS